MVMAPELPHHAITSAVDNPGAGVERVAEMFKLLGDPTRCRILFALLDAPDMRVLDIAAAVGAQPADGVGGAAPVADRRGGGRPS